ncbi:hypothetical protein GCM10023322_38180 [Rugosimonospora acidiphila]|uniref:Uncharacterized protein n=1 Tax=Rugosimonospora acidiphila TaxID=556531 RepID=A0ABP9RY25_9ACTN
MAAGAISLTARQLTRIGDAVPRQLVSGTRYGGRGMDLLDH